MGFVYALLLDKIQGSEAVWNFSKFLMIIRCLSILALYVGGTETCSELVQLAHTIRKKLIPASLLVRVVLQHAIKLLMRQPESLS